MSKNIQNEETVRRFLRAIEDHASSVEFEEFYHSNAEQIEFPNAINPRIAVRNLQQLQEGAEKGKQVLSSQKYTINALHSTEEVVVLEALWEGVLAIPLGKLQPGDTMKAHFAQVYEFQDGKILRQRNYDCFESFG